MRLSKQQTDIIIREAKDIFGPDACVKLFGSRMDDNKRGGDIDLLIELPHPLPNQCLPAQNWKHG